MLRTLSMGYGDSVLPTEKEEKMRGKLVLSGVTEAERKKAHEALAYGVEILGSQGFKDFVMNYSWSITYTTGMWWWKRTVTEKGDNFRWNWMDDGDPMTKEELYQTVMRAKELNLGEAADEEVDIFVEIDRGSNRGVIGYTNPGTKWQWVYSWFFKTYGVDEVAGNLIHEWLHKIGFDHEFKRSVLRDYTFVYAVGNWIVEQVKAKRRDLKEPNLDLVSVEMV